MYFKISNLFFIRKYTGNRFKNLKTFKISNYAVPAIYCTPIKDSIKDFPVSEYNLLPLENLNSFCELKITLHHIAELKLISEQFYLKLFEISIKSSH